MTARDLSGPNGYTGMPGGAPRVADRLVWLFGFGYSADLETHDDGTTVHQDDAIRYTKIEAENLRDEIVERGSKARVMRLRLRRPLTMALAYLAERRRVAGYFARTP